VGAQRVGRYEIIKTLGKGAMGVVYLARDPLIDRLIALKTLRLDVDSEFEEEFRQRFLREARAAGRLNHRGIVTVHDVGEDPETGLVYIAMEFIEGQDLKKRMQSKPPLGLPEISRIVAEIADALDYAHSMGVVHRDVKPANILLAPNGSPKVMDFGVARMESSNLTVEGQFIGTPNFMSPEQVLGKKVDGRSDIFSLGVLLFTLLTGKRPFPGSTMHEVTLKIVQEAAPVPSTLRPGLPTAFNPIILKCLEKDPEKRFQRASELSRLLAALGQALVSRDSGDVGQTGIVQPGLQTRVVEAAGSTRIREASPRTGSIPVKKARFSWRRLLKNIPLPEFFGWEVSSQWAIGMLLGWIILLSIPVAVLYFKIDRGPWPAPSRAGIRARHFVMRQCRNARQALNRGDTLAAETAALEALHQSPGSEGIRSLIREIHGRMEEESNSKETHLRARALRNEGQSFYRQGRYREAIASLKESLRLEPEDELASSYLELARERTRIRKTPVRRRSSSGGTSSKKGSPSPKITRVENTTAGLAAISLHYDAPLNSGLISITIDGEPLTEINFDFTKKGIFGIKRKGTGKIEKRLTLPSGKHKIGIFLTSPDMPKPSRKVFDKDLPPKSRWNLRIDQPSPGRAPSFYLLPLKT